MNKAFLILAFGAASLQAYAGGLNFVADRYIAMFEASASKPLPSKYPQLADRFRALFPERGAVKIEVPPSNEGSKMHTEIYIDGSNFEIVAPHGEWNFETDDQFVYEWQTDSNSGIRIKRANEDIVAFLYYSTDPSWIMAGLYFEYLKTPDSFQVRKTSDPGVCEFVLKVPIEGFESVFAVQQPLWFYGFKAAGSVFRFSAPSSQPQIPSNICGRRRGIVFADSEQTLAAHMVFL
jgi:hypothetical protein